MNGSFNKIIVINNKVIKVQSIVDEYSKKMHEEIDSKNYMKYFQDLKNNDIDVAKLFYSSNYFGKEIQIQEYIHGILLQEYMEDRENKISEKIELLCKLISIYMRTQNTDICLDLNMKNFILKNDKLVYIDLMPALYKSYINKNDSNPFKDNYVNPNYVMANLSIYFLRTILYLNKEEINKVKEDLKSIIEEITKISLDFNIYKKGILLEEYLNSNMTKELYEHSYQLIKRK